MQMPQPFFSVMGTSFSTAWFSFAVAASVTFLLLPVLIVVVMTFLEFSSPTPTQTDFVIEVVGTSS